MIVNRRCDGCDVAVDKTLCDLAAVSLHLNVIVISVNLCVHCCHIHLLKNGVLWLVLVATLFFHQSWFQLVPYAGVWRRTQRHVNQFASASLSII